MSKVASQSIKEVFQEDCPASSKYVSNFNLNMYKLEHTNQLQVEKTSTNQPKVKQPIVYNHYATSEDNRMIKITEIHFADRIIKIIDSLTFLSNHRQTSEVLNSNFLEKLQQSEPQDLREPKPNKRCISLLKRNFDTIRNVKNVVKNIYKIYLGWASQFTPPEKRAKLGQTLTEILDQNRDKYNNNLILRMFKDETVRNSFLSFADTAGVELINDSRIKDKVSHIQALHNYRRICEENSIKNEEESLYEQNRVKIEESEE